MQQQIGRYGGAELVGLQTCKALKAAGADVSAVSLSSTTPAANIEGIRHRSLYSGPKLWQHFKRKHRKLFLRRALFIEAIDADLVIVGHVNILEDIFEFCAARCKPVWLIVYGIDIWRESSATELSMLEYCDQIIAISRYTANQVKNRQKGNPKMVRIISPMVDTDLFMPATQEPPVEPRVILTVGRLSSAERYKGHDFIIRSLPSVTRQVATDVNYNIVGEGDDRPRLEKLAHDVGVAKQVHFFGRLEDSDVLQSYHKCHVFAMPSFVSQRPNGSWTGEGFGIVYIEAAACAKPVLACDVGGQVDAIQHERTGLLVKPDVESVANGLVKILENLDKAREMGNAGRRFVLDNFTKEHFKQKWLNLLVDRN